MRWLIHRGGVSHYKRWKEERQNIKFPAAAAIGSDPATLIAAVISVPETLSEYQFAGLLRKKPLELVSCKTIPLQVPAHAEIILEGYVSLDKYQDEGPYGDHTGYYNSAKQFPEARQNSTPGYCYTPFLSSKEAPSINVMVNINSVKLEGAKAEKNEEKSFHEVILHIEAKAIVEDENIKDGVAFICETKYCGIFSIENSTELSAEGSSYTGGILEYPQYTRPKQWRKHKVPEVLLSGNHEKISDWRQKQS